MLLIAQIMMILRNESMRIKRRFQLDIIIIVKAVVASEIMLRQSSSSGLCPRTRTVCNKISSLPCFNITYNSLVSGYPTAFPRE